MQCQKCKPVFTNDTSHRVIQVVEPCPRHGMADELAEALEFAGDHSYAGGRALRDIEPIKSVLARYRAAKEAR